jgi:hypothetical protein
MRRGSGRDVVSWGRRENIAQMTACCCHYIILEKSKFKRKKRKKMVEEIRREKTGLNTKFQFAIFYCTLNGRNAKIS